MENTIYECINPSWIEKIGFEVGCGRCMKCRLRRVSDWKLRLTSELYLCNHKAAIMTVTYDEDNIPEGNTLVKQDLRYFVKRCRKHLGKENKFRYYGVGEYGEEKGRPHYHIMFIGVEHGEALDRQVNKAWKKSIIPIKTKPLSKAGIGYVTKYVTKSMLFYTKQQEEKYYGDKQPPFQIYSTGIGNRIMLEEKDVLNSDILLDKDSITGQTYTIGKATRMIPYYWRKKYGIETRPEDIQEVIKKGKEAVKNDPYLKEYGKHKVDKMARDVEHSKARHQHSKK